MKRLDLRVVGGISAALVKNVASSARKASPVGGRNPP